MKKSFLKSRKDLWILVGFVVFVAVAFFSLSKINLSLLPFQGNAYANLILDFNNGQKRMFSGPVSDKMTILLALYSSAKEGGIDLRYAIDQAGDTRLGSIDGSSNRTVGKSWHFYLNEQPVATKDLNRIMVKRGDLIKGIFD